MPVTVDNVKDVISSNIARILKARGITKTDFASDAGYSEQHVYKILNKSGGASLVALVKLAEALGVELYELLLDEPTAVTHLLRETFDQNPKLTQLLALVERLDELGVAHITTVTQSYLAIQDINTPAPTPKKRKKSKKVRNEYELSS